MNKNETLGWRWAIWEQFVGRTRCSPPSYVVDSEFELGVRFGTLITDLTSRLRYHLGSSPWVRMGLSRGFVWARGGPWFEHPIGPIRNLHTKRSVYFSFHFSFSCSIPQSLNFFLFIKDSAWKIIETNTFLLYVNVCISCWNLDMWIIWHKDELHNGKKKKIQALWM